MASSSMEKQTRINLSMPPRMVCEALHPGALQQIRSELLGAICGSTRLMVIWGTGSNFLMNAINAISQRT